MNIAVARIILVNYTLAIIRIIKAWHPKNSKQKLQGESISLEPKKYGSIDGMLLQSLSFVVF